MPEAIPATQAAKRPRVVVSIDPTIDELVALIEAGVAAGEPVRMGTAAVALAVAFDDGPDEAA